MALLPLTSRSEYPPRSHDCRAEPPLPKIPLYQPRLPWSLLSLRRHQMRAATYTGFTSPSCATPPGFLSLLTFHSALILPALFRAGTALGISTFRGFPPALAANISRCKRPLLSFLRYTAASSLRAPESTPIDDTLVPTTGPWRRNARVRSSGHDPKVMIQKHPSLRIATPSADYRSTQP
jgi:hypothetical protein